MGRTKSGEGTIFSAGMLTKQLEKAAENSRKARAGYSCPGKGNGRLKQVETSRLIRSLAVFALMLSIVLIAGCEAPDWSIVSPEGANGKSFKNAEMMIGFRLVDKWLRIEVENLSPLAISWHWAKDSFTAPDGQVFTVAYFANFSRTVGKFEQGPLDGFVPTINSARSTQNTTTVIPAGRTLYSYICLVRAPKDYQYYMEHAYEDREVINKRMQELQDKYSYQIRKSGENALNSTSDPYMDFLPRLPGRKAYGEYRWKVKYYLGEELKNLELLFEVVE